MVACCAAVVLGMKISAAAPVTAAILPRKRVIISSLLVAVKNATKTQRSCKRMTGGLEPLQRRKVPKKAHRAVRVRAVDGDGLGGGHCRQGSFGHSGRSNSGRDHAAQHRRCPGAYA